MADTTQATTDGAAQDEQQQTTATTAETGASEKQQAETETAKTGSEDDKPVTHRDLRRVLKSKDHWKERALRLEGELKARQDAKPREQQTEGPKAPQKQDFEDYEKYLEAKAEWTADQRAAKIVEERLKARDEQASKAKAEESDRELTKSWQSSVAKTREKYDDYDEVTQDEEFNPTPAMARAMLESDQKAEIAYYLAKNPEELQRIAKFSEARQMAEIGKLEEKVSGAKSPPKKTSKAPAPIDPVGGGKGGSDGKLRDDMPIDEWMKLRQKQVYG